MKHLVIGLLVAVFIIILAIWYGTKMAEAPGNEASTHTFTSASGESIEVRFDNKTDTAIMTGRGYEELVFNLALSASGARYENTENNLVLWNKGDEITLYAGDQPIFSGTTNKAVSIEGTDWVWLYTDLKAGERITAPTGEKFVLSFDGEGGMSSRTDCNSMGGNYVLDGEVLSIGEMFMTKMYCEGSLEGVYAEQLGLVNSYAIVDDTLRLNLNRDYGVMVFKKQ